MSYEKPTWYRVEIQFPTKKVYLCSAFFQGSRRPAFTSELSQADVFLSKEHAIDAFKAFAVFVATYTPGTATDYTYEITEE